jgi:hypothetical protein
MQVQHMNEVSADRVFSQMCFLQPAKVLLKVINEK